MNSDLRGVAPGPETRLAKRFSDDYLLFEKLLGSGSANQTVMLGDSVLWGIYADDASTLPAKLNAGSRPVVNLGVDGLHPVAMYTLIVKHGATLRNRRVLLLSNPLWLSGPRHNLGDPQDAAVNHPGLLPPFDLRIRAGGSGWKARIGRWIANSWEFVGLRTHIRRKAYGDSTLSEWTLKHPAENPLSPLLAPLQPWEEPGQRRDLRTWTRRRISLQDWDWQAPARSLQWEYFEKTLSLLQAQGNRVAVLVSPLNVHMMTETTKAKYRELQPQIEARLKARGLPYLLLKDLPSEAYADASHPLPAGYATLAAEILANPAIPLE